MYYVVKILFKMGKKPFFPSSVNLAIANHIQCIMLYKIFWYYVIFDHLFKGNITYDAVKIPDLFIYLFWKLYIGRKIGLKVFINIITIFYLYYKKIKMIAIELWQLGGAKNVFLSIILHRFCKRKVHRITKILIPLKRANMKKK